MRDVLHQHRCTGVGGGRAGAVPGSAGGRPQASCATWRLPAWARAGCLLSVAGHGGGGLEEGSDGRRGGRAPATGYRTRSRGRGEWEGRGGASPGAAEASWTL